MSKRNPEHFPDHYIDEIREDPDDNYFTPVLQAVLRCIDRPEEVCDVGCGNGVFSIVLKRWVHCHLVGIDASEYALEQAIKRGFDEVRRIDDFSSDCLPFANASFDFVLSKDVLEHLLRPEHLVAEMTRVLRKGGHALIHVPNHFPLVGRVRLLLRNTIDPFAYFPGAKRWDFPHIRFFTMDSLIDLFGQAGFQVVGNFSDRFFLGGKLGRLMPAWCRRRLCANFPDAWTEGYSVLFRKEE